MLLLVEQVVEEQPLQVIQDLQLHQLGFKVVEGVMEEII